MEVGIDEGKPLPK